MPINNNESIIFSLNEYIDYSVMKEIKITNDNPMLEEIKIAMDELEEVRQYFNVVNDPELIEYAIYREKAAITKLSYLIKKVKNQKLEIVEC
jgi:hypothetical protein